jgi:AcrR family transcriptional regulator
MPKHYNVRFSAASGYHRVMASRGSYAKGVAKREEILQTALEVVARSGYGNATVREIAAAVGLSATGVLHYFGSKEELFTEILRRRDEMDARDAFPAASAVGGGGPASTAEAFADVIRHNASVPGLVQLYARLGAEAIDPAHGAHDYFRGRYAEVRSQIAAALRHEQDAGTMPASLDPERSAAILVAVADGLQSQWLYDPAVDMAAHVEYLVGLLRGTGEPSTGHADGESSDG